MIGDEKPCPRVETFDFRNGHQYRAWGTAASGADFDVLATFALQVAVKKSVRLYDQKGELAFTNSIGDEKP